MAGRCMSRQAGMQAAVIGGPALGGVVFVAGATTVYATCVALFAMGCVLMGPVGSVVAGGVGTLVVMAYRDRMVG